MSMLTTVKIVVGVVAAVAFVLMVIDCYYDASED